MSVLVDLTAKRRALVDRRRALKAELTGLARDIPALDHVLRMVDPEYRPEAPRPNKSRPGKLPFAHGEMTTVALDTLRRIGRPVSAADCARALMEDRNLSDNLHQPIANRFSALFAQKAASGQVRRVANGDGHHVKWEIAR